MGPTDTKMSRSAHGVRPLRLREFPSRIERDATRGRRANTMGALEGQAETAVFDDPEDTAEVDEEPDEKAFVALDDPAAVDTALDDPVEPDEAPASEGGELSTDSLQLFLKDVGKVELLTAAQEVELAK